jgi:hypothetical protein
MTLLVYGIGDARVLIAADTAITWVTEDAPDGYPSRAATRMHKINEVPGQALAWGLTGNAADVRRFRKGMESAPFDSWDALAEHAGQTLLAINAEGQRRAAAAKTPKRQVQKTLVLMGGRVEDRLEVVTIDSDGDVVFARDTGAPCGSVGVWGPTLQAALAVASYLDERGPDLSEPETLRSVVRGMCWAVPGLEEPVDVWMADMTSAGLVQQ